ncbi:hypothetical protein KR222_000335 [Zaprionus bogoriensis]|nr:hypothetical protein KR222_000335 [Zaprionus bogoriensis]
MAISSREMRILKRAKKTRLINKLIRIYHANECLWNPKSPGYYNLAMKEKAWQRISLFFKGDLSIDQLKLMIMSLRYYYERERLAIMTNELSGLIYAPRHSYYEKLHFLRDLNETDTVKSLAHQARLCNGQINQIAEDTFLTSPSQKSIHSERPDSGLSLSMDKDNVSLDLSTSLSFSETADDLSFGMPLPPVEIEKHKLKYRSVSGCDRPYPKANYNYASDTEHYQPRPKRHFPPPYYSDLNATNNRPVAYDQQTIYPRNPNCYPICSFDQWSYSPNSSQPRKKVLTGRYSNRNNPNWMWRNPSSPFNHFAFDRPLKDSLDICRKRSGNDNAFNDPNDSPKERKFIPCPNYRCPEETDPGQYADTHGQLNCNEHNCGYYRAKLQTVSRQEYEDFRSPEPTSEDQYNEQARAAYNNDPQPAPGNNDQQMQPESDAERTDFPEDEAPTLVPEPNDTRASARSEQMSPRAKSPQPGTSKRASDNTAPYRCKPDCKGLNGKTRKPNDDYEELPADRPKRIYCTNNMSQLKSNEKYENYVECPSAQRMRQKNKTYEDYPEDNGATEPKRQPPSRQRPMRQEFDKEFECNPEDDRKKLYCSKTRNSNDYVECPSSRRREMRRNNEDFDDVPEDKPPVHENQKLYRSRNANTNTDSYDDYELCSASRRRDIHRNDNDPYDEPEDNRKIYCAKKSKQKNEDNFEDYGEERPEARPRPNRRNDNEFDQEPEKKNVRQNRRMFCTDDDNDLKENDDYVECPSLNRRHMPNRGVDNSEDYAEYQESRQRNKKANRGQRDFMCGCPVQRPMRNEQQYDYDEYPQRKQRAQPKNMEAGEYYEQNESKPKRKYYNDDDDGTDICTNVECYSGEANYRQPERQKAPNKPANPTKYEEDLAYARFDDEQTECSCLTEDSQESRGGNSKRPEEPPIRDAPMNSPESSRETYCQAYRPQDVARVEAIKREYTEASVETDIDMTLGNRNKEEPQKDLIEEPIIADPNDQSELSEVHEQNKQINESDQNAEEVKNTENTIVENDNETEAPRASDAESVKNKVKPAKKIKAICRCTPPAVNKSKVQGRSSMGAKPENLKSRSASPGPSKMRSSSQRRHNKFDDDVSGKPVDVLAPAI